eukprot:scaffold43254_cov60-Phaeocystis_antarctica.AAC.1
MCVFVALATCNGGLGHTAPPLPACTRRPLDVLCCVSRRGYLKKGTEFTRRAETTCGTQDGLGRTASTHRFLIISAASEYPREVAGASEP